MLTHDALNTYVADRQRARVEAATAARTGRLLRRARAALGAAGPTGSAQATPAPVPTSSDPTRHLDGVGFADAASSGAASSPVVARATGATAGTAAGMPAVAALRTTAPTGTPAVQDGPAAA